ncbi:DUF3857 domain-containing protein [Seonamhaeicola marinus]|uniref:DUF3857 domain-containing protein n=1 Tax=Seonamhaeicola marinus TaxID=1912246 RepID=A0A5D0HJL0_9FLAO|nr:DUF3857 domain-containing protein [Seonamhaeicola marinus]TYA71573.1 DUF3857 domain-containing protein [Seonamhaeicola marinus]
MKKTTLILVLHILVFFHSHSQTTSQFNSESYRVTLPDIKATSFDKDSTANALIIYQHGKSWVNPADYKLKTKEQHKLKILKKEGFENATVKIYTYKKDNNTYEKVQDIIATTYNFENGNVVKSELRKKDIFKEEYNENFDVVKFTLPNVKEGSVITYSYTITSPFMFKYKGWEFQHDIPTLYSEYQTSIPGNWIYNIKLVGGKKLSTNTADLKRNCLEGPRGGSASCLESIYAMKDIPAFIEEDYMTTEDNYLARVEYELKTFTDFEGNATNYTKEWKDVDKELKTDQNIGKQLFKSIKLEDLLDAELINSPTTLEKAQAIYKFVQDNYTWNEKFRIFKDVSVKDLIKKKTGNVSSINILLHNILKESGYDVKPLMISTRQNGHPTKIYPVISDFNYLIVHVKIDDKDYLLDATDKYLSFGELPFRCLNQYGRLLNFNDGSEWYDIIPKKSDIFYSADLKIDDNLNVVGTIKSRITGQHAYDYRKSYFTNETTYVEKLENKSDDIIISDFETLESSKTNPVFKEKYTIEYAAEDTGDNIYLNPFFVTFFTENPFKLQERSYPIDFGYKDSYYYNVKLDFGDKYELVEKPKPIIVNLPNKEGKVFFFSTLKENSIILSLRIDFKQAVYPPEYYPYLKDFMKKVVDIQTNTVVLLKKK